MTTLRRNASRYAVAAVLAAMVVAVYGRVGGFPFIVLDDEPLILRNPAVQGGISAAGLRWAFSSGIDAGWIPLTWLSRLLDVSLFGMDAGKHHLVNVLFHLLNTLLLFAALRRMTGRMWESGLAAALFAVHPLHVESVAWVTERKDVLAGFFFLLALRAYARYVEKPVSGRYGPVLLFFVLALLSKPIVVTLPFVLLLLDFWPLGRLRGPWGPRGDGAALFAAAPPGRLIVEKIPLFVLSAAACAVTVLAQESANATVPLDAIPLWARAGNGLLSYAAYFRKAAWPESLGVFYPHPGTELVPWEVASAGLFLGLATALALRQARRRPWFAVGWLWYLGALMPMIGMVQAGGHAMADRCAYLPLIGIYLAAAWGYRELAGRLRVPKRAAAAAAAAWLLALSACAWSQVGYWQSSGTLFRRTLEVTRDNWLAHKSLGEAARRAGRDEEAVSHYRASLRIRPRSAQLHGDMAVSLLKTGNDEEAILHFQEALRIRPDFPEAHHNLGMALAGMGAREEGIGHLREAIRLLPGSAEAHNNLGVLLARRGATAEALSEFREALRIRPGYAGALRNLELAGSPGKSP